LSRVVNLPQHKPYQFTIYLVKQHRYGAPGPRALLNSNNHFQGTTELSMMRAIMTFFDIQAGKCGILSGSTYTCSAWCYSYGPPNTSTAWTTRRFAKIFLTAKVKLIPVGADKYDDLDDDKEANINEICSQVVAGPLQAE
jgi:hypothetical protein